MTELAQPVVLSTPPTIPQRREPAVNWQELAVTARFKPLAVANLCGLSVRTVQRHFRKHYRMTLGEWLRSYRLQLAYERLRAGESIKCVAIDLGYKQLSHFSRDFKNHFGCAPKFLNAADVTVPEGKLV
jgi:AraC-like DNA-binding protein